MSRRRPLLLCLAALLLTGVPLLAGCDDAEPETGGDSLLALVTAAEDLDVLEGLIGDLALSNTLRANDDLTFFAPTNEALNALGTDMLDALRSTQNRDVLEKLLRRHLVPGRLTLADLSDGMILEPLDGPPLEVRVETDDDETIVTVDGARITEPDLGTGNGILHQVNDLVRDHLTLEERLRVTPLLSAFAELLNEADLSDLAASGEPRTLLVPINSAFDALGPGLRQSLERFDNRNVLRTILRHHAVPGRLRADSLDDGDTLEPLDGEPLPVRVEGGLTFLGEARVIVPEIETSDGLIYLLDTVVLSHLDLAERLKIEPELTTFYEIFGAADLLGELGGEKTFTLFVPTDDALAPLGDPAFVDALRLRPDLLLRTAQYHAVPGRIEPDDLLSGGFLTTLGDYELQVQVGSDVGGPTVFVGGRGNVAFPPIETRNGLIYAISPFIYPPELDLEERAVFGALYSFLNVMRNADLTPLLRGEAPWGDGPYTIFAPTDAAFDAEPVPASERRRTMEYHIVEGYYDAAEAIAADSLVLPTLAGPDLGFYSILFQGLFVADPTNSILLTAPDLRATNGVIHAIDGVLDPPE